MKSGKSFRPENKLVRFVNDIFSLSNIKYKRFPDCRRFKTKHQLFERPLLKFIGVKGVTFEQILNCDLNLKDRRSAQQWVARSWS